MKILVIGGMHGNEKLGIRLVELLKQTPIPDVDVIIANPEAVMLNKRFVESDLNRSFGHQQTVTLETKRAQELLKVAEQYDIVLDFHNTQTPNNNCAFVGINCQPILYDAIRAVGINRCIEATYDCVNKYCLNTVSIEISIGDTLDDAAVWYEKIVMLMTSTKQVSDELSVYQFRRRVTWSEKREYDFNDWQPFKLLNEAEKKKLTIIGDIVPIFIGSRLTEYYATILEKTGVIK